MRDCRLRRAKRVVPKSPGVSASRDAAETALNAKLSLTGNVALLANFAGRCSGVETAVGGFGGVQVTW